MTAYKSNNNPNFYSFRPCTYFSRQKIENRPIKQIQKLLAEADVNQATLVWIFFGKRSFKKRKYEKIK